MGRKEVVIIATGLGNVASVRAAFFRLGYKVHFSTDAGVVEGTELLVLPGVGSFGCGMEQLRAFGLDQALLARLRAGKPVLAICLGLQLLCEESAESPGMRGLGFVAAKVERFKTSLRVPQMGWNEVRPQVGWKLAGRGQAYFANSYAVFDLPGGFSRASTDYGGQFVSAFATENLLACQFHPELSGPWGMELLNSWARSAGG